MIGSLSVPNVGVGDIVVTFNKFDGPEVERAIKMLTDMQARGYAILVRRPDNTYSRAVRIDASSGCYIIAEESPASFDADVADQAGQAADPDTEAPPADTISADPEPGGPGGDPLPVDPEIKPRGRRGRKPKNYSSQPIASSHAVGVARSAGG